MTRRFDRRPGPERAASAAFPQTQCGKIHDLLTAFVTNELGDAQSSLVREHLRQCPKCRQSALQTRKAFDLLRAAGQFPSSAPNRLSDDRRARIMRAYAQPLLTWFRLYAMMLAGILLSVAVVLALLVTLVATWRQQPEPIESEPITVTQPFTLIEEPLDAVNTNIDPDAAARILPLLPEPLTPDIDRASPLLPIPPDSEGNQADR